MNTDAEKLSIIAEAFATIFDLTADSNRVAWARQRIKDALDGYLIHVVSAATYAGAVTRYEQAEKMLATCREENMELANELAKPVA
jgi:hypothetical protein